VSSGADGKPSGCAGPSKAWIVRSTGPKRRRPVADHWRPRPPGDALDLTLDAFGQLARIPFEQTRLLARAAHRPGEVVARLRGTIHGLAVLAQGFLPATPTSVSGPLGRARRYAVARMPLADIAVAADAHEVTVNDVYLAAVAGAFRRLLLSRGEEPHADAVRTLVPVSMRGDGERHLLDNRLASMLLQLPVELEEPADRLRAVHRRVAELRANHEVEAGVALVALAEQEPFAAVSFLIRTALRTPQRAVATVTTNVPGPAVQLYILGRPVREILPYVPIAERMRIGVALLTYAGQAAFGITADFASVPEADDFAAAVVDEVGRLRAAASPRTAAAPKAPRRLTASAARIAELA
jgi:diacylglycerol O-acyltransferase